MISKPEQKQQMSRISSRWSLQLQITHHLVWIQCEVLRCAGTGWGCAAGAQLPSPPLLLFQGQQWGRGWSAQGWCDGHEGSGSATRASHHEGGIPAPCSSGKHCLPNTCLAASAGVQPLPGQAPAAWGAGLQGVAWYSRQGAWFEERDSQTGTWDKQHRARHKTKKLSGSSELPHLF